MYLLRTTPERKDIIEVTPEVLDSFLSLVAKPNSQASRDAALFTLSNGSELRSRLNPGMTWRRVHKPIVFTPRPTTCQLTNMRLGSVMYDGKIKDGPWAIMCEKAWEAYGCGRLGTGFGQKYLRNSDGDFYISEGWISAPRPYRVSAA